MWSHAQITSYRIPQFAKPVGAILDTQKIIMPRLRLGYSPSNKLSQCLRLSGSEFHKIGAEHENALWP